MEAIALNAVVEAEMAKVAEAAGYLWMREWAERNGGNISLNLSGLIEGNWADLDRFRHVAQEGFPREAAGMLFFVSGTGERLRELIRPQDTACILRIDDQAAGYHFVWGGGERDDFRPTSELISHLKILLDKSAGGSSHRCVVHTHPIELICMTHHPRYAHDEAAFNRAIWGMLPEIRAFVPRGVGLTPYALPGSEALADLTVAALRSHDVALWEKHGALATGRDALEAFDYIDVANKGAKVFLKCLSCGFEPEGMSDGQLAELVRAFNL